MNYNVTLFCCSWWVGRREPCMFIAQLHHNCSVTCLFDSFRLCYHFTDIINYRKLTIRFFTVRVKVTFRGMGIGTNSLLHKGLKKGKHSKIKVRTKWACNLQSIYDNLRCVKNPRFVRVQTLLRLPVRLFTTFVKVTFFNLSVRLFTTCVKIAFYTLSVQLFTTCL